MNGSGTGVPFAAVTGITNDGSTVTLPAYQCNQNGCGVVPIVLPNNLTSLYIVLYGTGIRNAHYVAASLGPVTPQVDYFGAQSQYPGLDQVNLHVTNTSGLSGTVSLILLTDGTFSNSVDLLFQ